MTKAISSFHGAERVAVIKRRLLHKTGGLGYLAAVDSQKAIAEGKAKAKAEEGASKEAS